MCAKVEILRALVSERLSAAAEEIFALVERTISEYEEELCRCRDESQRNQQILQENQRNQQLLQENQRNQQLLQENQRNQQLVVPRGRRSTADAQVQASLDHGHFSPHMKDYSEILGQDFNCSVKNESGNQSEEEEDEWAQSNSSAPPLSHSDGQFSQEQTEGAAGQFSQEQTEGAAGLFPPFKFGDFSDKSPGAVSDFCSEEELVKHQCHFCEKKFRDKHNLRRHIAVHTGEKPFSCTVCARSFSQRETLRQHMGLHSRPKTEARVKRGGGSPRVAPGSPRAAPSLPHDSTASPCKNTPFSCPVCARCFTRPFSLQSHMVTHTGEKPFLCLQCNMRFNRKSNLKRHAKTHVPK